MDVIRGNSVFKEESSLKGNLPHKEFFRSETEMVVCVF